MHATVVPSHRHNFYLRDKGNPREESREIERESAYYFEQHTKRKPSRAISKITTTRFSPRIKGFPVLPYLTISNPTFHNLPSTYQYIPNIHNTFSPINLTIDILPPRISYPNLMQIFLYIKVLFKI